MKPWRRIGSRRIHSCGIFHLDEVRFAPPDAGDARAFFVLDLPDWINVIPLTDAGEVLLLRQYRFGIGEHTLEIPGGMCDPGEPPREAALRELREETGHAAGELTELGWVHPNPPLQTNRCFSYLARGLQRVGDPQPDPDERFEIVSLPLSRIPELIAERRITHALVLAAFQLLDGSSVR